eukprot:CAMPEP_0185036454 /NCGR_PEP_ID=MMETSP1103-20130426/29487_1 /TAXON_ID=36769 /ORGANISM="Paraphysomonas bandaiensis, Strain Caron Lab Isolate" /LENGTH=592 /DNA_ID=CAMNT_0027573995 /DNA_START=456 /DNA_END=2234 /DNA_ORIENTATION=+
MRKPILERPTFVRQSLTGYDPNFEDSEQMYSIGESIAQNCQAYGSGLFGAEAGQQAEFMIQLFSPEGEQLGTGGLPFTASLMDNECLYHIGVHDNENGSFSAFYVISRPGTYELSILLNDEHHIYGSPFSVEVLPSQTDPLCSVASGDALSKLIPGVRSVFTVTAMDSFGNKKRRGGDPFELGVMGPARLHGLQDNGDGTYTCAIEAQHPADQPFLTAASVSVMVTLHGKHIKGSPFRPTVDLTAKRQEDEQQQHTSRPATGYNFPSQPPPVPTKPSRERSAISTPSHSPRGNGERNGNDDGGLSKLELARLRALQAAKEQEGASLSAGSNNTASGTQASRRPPSTPQNSVNQPHVSSEKNPGGKMSQRVSKLDQMAQRIGTARKSVASPVSPLASAPPPPPPADLLDALEAGLLISPPENLSNEFRRLWSVTHGALTSKEIANLIATNAVALQNSFNIAAEPPSYRLAFLSSQSGNCAGLYRLMEEFDVIPTYMSKKELKSLFLLIVKAQEKSGVPLASFLSSKGKEGITYVNFLKLLVMIAIHCLSKTSAFNSLYTTVKSKVDVMLFNWGFAEPLKIRTVQDHVFVRSDG